MAHVAIVGAGIAGLTAGVYARQSGFEATIYESHYIPGGASTSWSRKGYLFEGGMHWLTGSAPNSALNRVWHEVGALNPQVPIYNRDPFLVFECQGQTVNLYRNVDRLERHLLEIAPEDATLIKKLMSDIRKFANMETPIVDIKGVKVQTKHSLSLFDMLKMLPSLTRMPAYAKQTAGSYAKRYQNTALRELFGGMVGEDMSAVGLAFTLATLAKGDGGYPLGGSLAMARRMADTFEQLGGTIAYKTPVERVAVEGGRATGIIVAGETLAYDAVIVTQDTVVAIDALFDPPINDAWAQTMREKTLPILNTFVCLGIKADLSDIPESVGFTLDEPLYCAEQPSNLLSINNYATYENYAPVGCSAVTAFINGDTYDWWAARKADGTYAQEKKKLAEAIIAAMVKQYPQVEGKVEVWDVATPLTYERYLHSYKGSWMSNMPVGETPKPYPAQPENISSVYFAGQRLVAPGGLPTAVDTGRAAVQYLCRDTNTVFQGAMKSA